MYFPIKPLEGFDLALYYRIGCYKLSLSIICMCVPMGVQTQLLNVKQKK